MRAARASRSAVTVWLIRNVTPRASAELDQLAREAVGVARFVFRRVGRAGELRADVRQRRLDASPPRRPR